MDMNGDVFLARFDNQVLHLWWMSEVVFPISRETHQIKANCRCQLDMRGQPTYYLFFCVYIYIYTLYTYTYHICSILICLVHYVWWICFGLYFGSLFGKLIQGKHDLFGIFQQIPGNVNHLVFHSRDFNVCHQTGALLATLLLEKPPFESCDGGTFFEGFISKLHSGSCDDQFLARLLEAVSYQLYLDTLYT